MNLQEFLKHKENIERRMADSSRRKLHIVLEGRSLHGGYHATVFVMGTWFIHTHINNEMLGEPDLFKFMVSGTLKNSIEALLEQATQIEGLPLLEELKAQIINLPEESTNEAAEKKEGL